jgi:hypothetical protein
VCLSDFAHLRPLQVNGVAATCVAPSGPSGCAFAFSTAATPTVAAVQPSGSLAFDAGDPDAAATLTVQGSGFAPALPGAAVAVTLGPAPCTVLRVNDTHVSRFRDV